MWADAVFEGGGVKAIGLVGALHAAEQRGYQWRRVAGTSAGAIIASLVAAGYESREIHDAIARLDYQSFITQDWWHQIPYVGPAARLWVKKGLYAGKEIECWMEDMLAQKGIRTFADLPETALHIVVSDLTRGRLTILPRDLHLYGIASRDLTIARAVRMSCSIPFFFEPVIVHSRTGPRRNYIVDGGVLSNFPIWLFDDEHPRWPTFGFRLVTKTEGQPHHISGPISLFLALFQTMLDAHDMQHIEEQHRVRTIMVPSLGVKSTDFHISPEQSSALFDRGVKAAEDFFAHWDFATYMRNFRQKAVYAVRIGAQKNQRKTQ